MRGERPTVRREEKIWIVIGIFFFIIAVLPMNSINITIPDYLLYLNLLTPGGYVAILLAPARFLKYSIFAIFPLITLFYIIPRTVSTSSTEQKEFVNKNTNFNFLPVLSDYKPYIIPVLLIPFNYVYPNFLYTYLSILLYIYYYSFQKWSISVFIDKEHTNYINSLPIIWKKVYTKGMFRLIILPILIISINFIFISNYYLVLLRLILLSIIGKMNFQLQRNRFEFSTSKVSILQFIYMLVVIVIIGVKL